MLKILYFSSVVDQEREVMKFNAQRRRDQNSNHDTDDWFVLDRYHTNTEVCTMSFTAEKISQWTG